ncbi:MAG: retroviral-like aspartic protease family protein [Muribaculaceae bacterium]|nr:retroviral-like aspartic protease family protein [Muribaculaceae bacterium]
MKKQIYTIFFILVFCAFSSMARTVIRMEPYGGVFKIPCVVNGAKMKFIFDTGASTVTISESTANYMLENGFLTENDIKGVGKSSVADGRIVDHVKINLKDIEIGGLHLSNVEAVVIMGQESPLLLGQSVIQSMGKISIEGNNLIIEDGINDLGGEELEELEQHIDDYMKLNNWYSAIDCLEKLDKASGLTARRLVDLAECYFKLSNTKNKTECNKCIEVCQRYLSRFGETSSDNNHYLVDIYFFLACCNEVNSNHKEAISWWQKCYDIESDALRKNYCLAQIGSLYSLLGESDIAIKFFKDYFNKTIPLLGLSKSQVYNGSFKKTKKTTIYIAEILTSYAFVYYDKDDESNGNTLMRIAAICGSNDAIDYCKEYNIPINAKKSQEPLF